MVPTAQIPGVYHRKIGDIVVTALSDGYLDGVVEVMQNIAPADATKLLTDQFRPGRRTSVNCYLVYSAGRLALIETGSGDYLLPTAGKLQQNLKAAGVNPADIDTVILTHMHPDHSAGLMAPYHNQMRTFDGAVEVFPGVTSVPLHGHTPGHSGYMIASGGQSLLIWGDIIHVPEVQVAHPEVTMVFDTDPHAAAATRRRTFDMVATDRQLVAGMHVHFPGFAHVVKDGKGGYLMLPEPWDQGFGG